MPKRATFARVQPSAIGRRKSPHKRIYEPWLYTPGTKARREAAILLGKANARAPRRREGAPRSRPMDPRRQDRRGAFRRPAHPAPEITERARTRARRKDGARRRPPRQMAAHRARRRHALVLAPRDDRLVG